MRSFRKMYCTIFSVHLSTTGVRNGMEVFSIPTVVSLPVPSVLWCRSLGDRNDIRPTKILASVIHKRSSLGKPSADQAYPGAEWGCSIWLGLSECTSICMITQRELKLGSTKLVDMMMILRHYVVVMILGSKVKRQDQESEVGGNGLRLLIMHLRELKWRGLKSGLKLTVALSK